MSIKESKKRAFELFKKSAHQGDAKAQYYCGLIYYNEKINGVSNEEAVITASAWFEKSGKQGHPTAQHRLGEMYCTGELERMSVNETDAEAVY